MQSKNYTGTFNRVTLNRELAVVPGFRKEDAPRVLAPDSGTLKGTDDGVTVMFPDAVKVALIDAVIAAHDATAKAQSQVDQDTLKALRAKDHTEWTTEEIQFFLKHTSG
jgi:hypothetical protein